MYSKRRAQLADKVVNKRLKKDYWARFYGQLIYKQKKKHLLPDTLQQIQDELLAKGLYSQAEASSKKYYLRIIASDRKPKGSPFFFAIFLFFATLVTTTLTGAEFQNRLPFESWENFKSGLPYALALLTILFVHEMGHYIAARLHKVRVSPPFFLPFYFPLMLSFGTFGAFIKLREAIPNRKVLFDIGAAGPIAGFITSLLFLYYGFSEIESQHAFWQQVSQIHPIDPNASNTLTFGNMLAFRFMAITFGPGEISMSEMYHFPFILAGWFGLILTALNLMPIGQLDGGHITHALFGVKSAKIAMLSFALIIVLNIVLISQYNSLVYILWPILILVFIKFKHPPTINETIRLGWGRRIIGLIAYFILMISFSPLPIYFQ